MIQIMEIYPSGTGRTARLGCSCGQDQLAEITSRHGSIIFCGHCGQLTTPSRLRASFPGGAAADLAFETLPPGQGCPLVSVALPARCAWSEPSEFVSGTITKLSPERIILRLTAGTELRDDLLRTGAVWCVSCLDPVIPGNLPARLCQVLQPQSAAGTTYYELELDALEETLGAAVLHFYHRQCAGDDEPAAPLPAAQKGITVDEHFAFVDHAAHLSAEALGRLYETASPLSRGAAPNLTVEAEEFVSVLCMASESHDTNSSNHLKRIAAYSAAVAHELGWTSRRVSMLATASKLHDVGKLGVPDVILRKPGALTLEERRVMQQHTRFGWQILQASASEVVRLGAAIALRHHERIDGQGYPDGLAGELIPVEAQVVSMVDVFDALTSARAYKPAWSNMQARDYLREQSGKMFMPELVRAFETVWPEIEKNQLRFLDDFRDIWTERRKATRMQTDPIPLQMEIAVPEQTFRPLRLTAVLVNHSPHGIKVRVQGVSNDLFSLFVASRRYAKITFPAILGSDSDGSFCQIVWMDYYAVPDPEACLMGLEFQKLSPEHAGLFQDLRNTVGAVV